MNESANNNPAQKIRLLVAEDSAGTRHNLINMLSYEPEVEVVGVAGSARQAIDQTLQLQPNVVLMDINLPDMDGLTATTYIRRLLPQVTIIIMSVHDEDAYQKRALAAGASAFLVKPFLGDDLMDTLRRLTTRR
jgi:DNA-binding NarL/FixJ family response regulator